MAQYTTGKMNNPNASIQVQTVPGSKGVFVGLNQPVTVQTVAKGRVGGTSTAPGITSVMLKVPERSLLLQCLSKRRRLKLLLKRNNNYIIFYIMDKISRLKQKETRLVSKGNKAVDEGREKKADRLLGRAAKTQNRVIKLTAKKGGTVSSRKK